jgi:hypothetical protein
MINTLVDFVVDFYIPIMLIYLAGGIVYAVAKWTYLILKLRSRVAAITEADVTAEQNRWGTKRTYEEVRQSLRDKLTVGLFGSGTTYRPNVTDNKGNLMMWAIFWPFNLIYTMFADVAYEFFSMVYNKIGSALNAIAKSLLPD